MAETITLQLPDSIMNAARTLAERTNRPVDAVLVAWLEQWVNDAPVDTLPDDQLLALTESEMTAPAQDELSALLAANREGALSSEEGARLDALMAQYRQGLVRKAQALKVAVERGLRASA
jgi:hypothetical protein